MRELLDGKDYLLVHTEPGTNKITAYEFDPGTAKSFHLEQSGSALMTRPAAGVGATPIAHPASQPNSRRSDAVRSVRTGARVGDVDSGLLGKVVAADLTPKPATTSSTLRGDEAHSM
ncbi:hypothetical protein [Rhodococcus qingshengii]|uniref:hypothetical protein n=1 Tax=Rhodococcus qingshengii TaxID=334542 RepID=UPI0018DADD84|nr:hypothetical protein [Rhodococcus qingshengii]QPG89723.1 hypothetical protein I1G86_00040 [Rhodococcus qingshengii]